MGLSRKRKASEFYLEEFLSPSKALRATVLKRRSIDTIAKAKQRSSLHQGNKAETVELHLERKKLKRKHHKKELRHEAKVRVVQATPRIKAEADQILKREKEREAACGALQLVKKTFDLDNTELLRDLERLNCSWTWHRQKTDAFKHCLTHELENFGFLNPLEKLGLFIKDDEMTDEDLEIYAGDVEEGEIIDAENERCISKAATSHNLILQKEATAVWEKPSENRVSLSEKKSAPNSELEAVSKVKALRAARLKMRFADTIAKAQHTLMNQGKNADPAKLKLEQEMLKKNEQKELASLEAEVRKQRIEKERAASRNALEQVKKTVDLDNSEVLEEVKKLNWSCASCYWNSEGSGLGNLNFVEKVKFPVMADDDTEDGEITD